MILLSDDEGDAGKDGGTMDSLECLQEQLHNSMMQLSEYLGQLHLHCSKDVYIYIYMFKMFKQYIYIYIYISRVNNKIGRSIDIGGNALLVCICIYIYIYTK